jgi:hypothetical protein
MPGNLPGNFAISGSSVLAGNIAKIRMKTGNPVL